MRRSSGTKSKPKILTADELQEFRLRRAVCETKRSEHAMLLESYRTWIAMIGKKYGVRDLKEINTQSGELIHG